VVKHRFSHKTQALNQFSWKILPGISFHKSAVFNFLKFLKQNQFSRHLKAFFLIFKKGIGQYFAKASYSKLL
jgi:hypothetical protein